jgi:hypothetical protein
MSRVRGYEFIIEGDIGSDVDGGDLLRDLKNFHDEEVTFTIFSGGGSVFHALAVYEYIRANNIKAYANVYGIAASSATIFMAAAGRDRTFISPHSQVMVHAPYGGDPNALKKIHKEMVAIYRRVTGLNKAQVEDLLAQDTFMDAKTAEKLGFGVVMDEMAIAAYYNLNHNNMEVKSPEEGTPKHRVDVSVRDVLRGYVEVADPDQVEATINELVENAKASANEIADLALSVEAKDKEIESLTAKVTELETGNENAKAEGEASNETIKALEATIEELKGEIKVLEAEPAVEAVVEEPKEGIVEPAQETKPLTPVEAAEERRLENLRLHNERFASKHLK